MAKMRTATRRRHEQLDRDTRMAAYFQTRHGVGELLGRWYGFFVPYETELGGMIQLSQSERAGAYRDSKVRPETR